MERIAGSRESAVGRGESEVGSGDVARDEGFHRVTEILRCKWTMSILDAIAKGINRPGRLERALPGLTAKVLHERIDKLERYGMLVRRAHAEVPPRVEYELTERGRRLCELVATIGRFVDDWEADGDRPA